MRNKIWILFEAIQFIQSGDLTCTWQHARCHSDVCRTPDTAEAKVYRSMTDASGDLTFPQSLRGFSGLSQQVLISLAAVSRGVSQWVPQGSLLCWCSHKIKRHKVRCSVSPKMGLKMLSNSIYLYCQAKVRPKSCSVSNQISFYRESHYPWSGTYKV